MENLTVKNLVNSIKEDLNHQTSSSMKDEVSVMMAMMNDKTYIVEELGKDGQVVGTFCPAEIATRMAANIIKGATKVSTAEAEELANSYEFGKKEATAMVTLSKEYINTYLDCGRKIKFGNREGKSLVLSQKEKETYECKFPKKVGYDSNGNAQYELSTTTIKGYKEVKANSRPK